MSKIVVWKYDVPVSDEEFTIEMPKFSTITRVENQVRLDLSNPLGVQRINIKLWALVNPEAKKISRTFRVLPTGQEIETPEPVTAVVARCRPRFPGYAESIRILNVPRGTVLVNGGQLVLHLVEFMLSRPMPFEEDHEKYADWGSHR